MSPERTQPEIGCPRLTEEIPNRQPVATDQATREWRQRTVSPMGSLGQVSPGRHLAA